MAIWRIPYAVMVALSSPPLRRHRRGSWWVCRSAWPRNVRAGGPAARRLEHLPHLALQDRHVPSIVPTWRLAPTGTYDRRRSVKPIRTARAPTAPRAGTPALRDSQHHQSRSRASLRLLTVCCHSEQYLGVLQAVTASRIAKRQSKEQQDDPNTYQIQHARTPITSNVDRTIHQFGEVSSHQPVRGWCWVTSRVTSPSRICLSVDQSH